MKTSLFLLVNHHFCRLHLYFLVGQTSFVLIGWLNPPLPSITHFWCGIPWGIETVVPPPLAMDPSPPSSESEDELQLPGAVVEEKKTPDCGEKWGRFDHGCWWVKSNLLMVRSNLMLRLLRHRKFGGYNVVLQYIFTGKIQVFQGALQVFPAVQSLPWTRPTQEDGPAAAVDLPRPGTENISGVAGLMVWWPYYNYNL